MTQSQSQTKPTLPTSLQRDVVFDTSFLDFLIDFRLKSEPQSELYNFHARFYDPEIGRFISYDAAAPVLEDPLTLNRYSYVTNNPLKYIDPDGNKKRLPSPLRFLEYGNYGGPGWVGGNVTPMLPPLDSLDIAYMRHDFSDNYDGGVGFEIPADKVLINDLKSLSYDTSTWDTPPESPVRALIHKNLALSFFQAKVYYHENNVFNLDFTNYVPYSRHENMQLGFPDIQFSMDLDSFIIEAEIPLRYPE